MSQFLICKSKQGLSEYGVALKDIRFNKELYFKVIKQYLKNREIDNVWIIEKIDFMITHLENYLHVIEKIGCRSELMIFWYGCDFLELDRLNSQKELMHYLKSNIANPCLELYLYVELDN